MASPKEKVKLFSLNFHVIFICLCIHFWSNRLGNYCARNKSSKLSAVKGDLEDDCSKMFSKGIEKKELRRTEGISM